MKEIERKDLRDAWTIFQPLVCIDRRFLILVAQVCKYVVLFSLFHPNCENNGYLRLINTIKINLYSSQIQLAAK